MTENLIAKYAPKEIALFEATLRLLAAGDDIHQLKISQIAAEAGIGKGTVYEYFDSKETLIHNAMLYCLKIERQKANEMIKTATTFQQAIFMLFDMMHQNLTNPLSSFWLLFTGIQMGHKKMPVPPCKEPSHLAQTRAQARCMIELARKEGLVGADVTDDECFVAIKSAAAAYLTPALESELGDEGLRLMAYRLLLKMLA